MLYVCGGMLLELLKELLPRLARVAALWDAANPYPAIVFKETQAAAQALAIDVQIPGNKTKPRMTSMVVSQVARKQRPERIDNGRRPSHL